LQIARRSAGKLNVVRRVFSNREFPSMIAALKQAIAIYTDDPAWARSAAAAGRTHARAG
jgi:hypothetical protein